MIANHTPGPWSLPHFAQPDVNCECGYVLTDHLMGAVATVHCSGEGEDCGSHGDNPKFSEAVANAHLIAAAPDLLAALVCARQWVEANTAQVRGLSAEAAAPGESMLAQIDAALSKANAS